MQDFIDRITPRTAIHGAVWAATGLIAVLTLTGCGGGSGNVQVGDGDNATGILDVSVTDAPVDDAAEVWVQFTGVRVKPSNGPEIAFTFDTPVDVDLLTLTGTTSTTLVNGEEVPAGSYDWIALDVNAEFDGVFDSYVVPETGGNVELRVPSGSQQGLRLVSGFTVLADATNSFVIDWDLRKALTNPVGQPGYFLRPALRITDLAEYGSIAGTVADALVMDDATCNNDLAEDEGNLVYVFQGADVMPDDMDGTDPEPLTTARVTQDSQAAGAYTYAATYLPPGPYTVAFTCQGLTDEPDTSEDLAFTGAQNVTVVANEEATADF